MALKDITGFIRRFSATEGMTDATYGFPYGSTNVATAFSAPGRGAGGTDGWATRSGATGGTAGLLLPNALGGPQTAYVGGPGLAFQFDATGASPDMYYADGTVANQVPFDGGTMILCGRFPLSFAAVTDMTNPATINSSAKFWGISTLASGAGHYFGWYAQWNRAMFGSYDGAATVACAAQLSAGREIIAVRSNTGANAGVTICVIRNGAIVAKLTAGTTSATTGNFVYLGSDAGGSSRGRFICEDIALFKSNLSDADVLTAAAEMRATYETTAYAPTMQLDIIGDSITGGYLTLNGASYVAHLAARLPNLFILPFGVAGADAQTWDSTTIFDGTLVGGYNTDYPTITKREGLVVLGTNGILAGQASATWIGYMNNVADRYLALTGKKPFAMVPVGCGHGTVGGNKETLRRQYRTALLASTHFKGVIDTDTLEPTLVPSSATDYATGYCMGGINFQLPTSTSGAHALPGTLVYNTKAVGLDGIHPGIIGHQAIANMLMRATSSGFAQAIGSASIGGFKPMRNRNQ